MRIDRLHLNNFKCFEDIQIELGRITILTGANSSGKSSLIQSMLAPLQSSDFPFTLSTNGRYVNLGDFEDISFMHESKKIIDLNYYIDLKRSYEDENNDKKIELKTSWFINEHNRLPKLFSLSANSTFYKLNIQFKEEKYHLKWQYFSDKDPEKANGYSKYQALVNILKTFNLESESDNDKEEDIVMTKLQKSFQINDKTLTFTAKNLFDLHRKIYEKGSYVLKESIKDIQNFFSRSDLGLSFNFISSFRYNPQKTRFEVAKQDLKVGRHGENYEDQIVLWELQNDKQFEKLYSVMSKLKLFEHIKVERIKGGNYHLTLKIHKKGSYSSITDVGFGISQFLPVIVADLQLTDESTLVISQPEVHLHPSVQSDFGDYLVENINTTQKNYIIETHSEYLFNKLRLLIVKGQLKREDLKIYYISNQGDSMVCYDIELTSEGQIKNAPQEFFDTYMIDVMDIALNAH